MPWASDTLAARASAAEASDRERIAKIRQAYWASIETMVVEIEEFPLEAKDLDGDAELKPKSSSYVTLYDIAIASNGRRAMRFRTRSPEGEIRINSEVGEDGRNLYATKFFMTGQNDMDTINILKQKDQTSFLRELSSFLWLLMPGGKTCFDQLQAGGRIVIPADRSRSEAEYEFTRKGSAVHCEIDPEHDYLPRRVVIGEPDEKIAFEAREFKKIGGHWFPASGFVNNASKLGGDRYAGFRVVKLKLNEPVDPAMFQMPRVIPPGVQVVENTTFKGYVSGPPGARDEVAKRHPASPAAVSGAAMDAPDLIAAEAPRVFPWRGLILAGGVAALVSALCLRRRFRRDA